MDKIKLFKKELEYIKSDDIRKSTEVMINLLPDYFFTIPASSTGKYHPKYASGEGGLVRHVKAAVYFAKELFTINTFDQESMDLIFMSLILHDGLKKGLEEEEFTRFDHPILMADFIKDNKDKLSLTDEELDKVCAMIRSHMGHWNTSSSNPDLVLPLPVKKEERFVHMCDYLASRRQIQFEFNEQWDILE